MAQKTHPIGLRLGVSHTWDSSWYPNRDEGNHYSELLHKDLELRRLIQHFVEESHGLLLGSVHIARIVGIMIADSREAMSRLTHT